LGAALETSDSIAIGPEDLRAEGEYYESLLTQDEYGQDFDSVESLPSSMQRNSNAYPELYDALG